MNWIKILNRLRVLPFLLACAFASTELTEDGVRKFNQVLDKYKTIFPKIEDVTKADLERSISTYLSNSHSDIVRLKGSWSAKYDADKGMIALHMLDEADSKLYLEIAAPDLASKPKLMDEFDFTFPEVEHIRPDSLIYADSIIWDGDIPRKSIKVKCAYFEGNLCFSGNNEGRFRLETILHGRLNLTGLANNGNKTPAFYMLSTILGDQINVTGDDGITVYLFGSKSRPVSKSFPEVLINYSINGLNPYVPGLEILAEPAGNNEGKYSSELWSVPEVFVNGERVYQRNEPFESGGLVVVHLSQFNGLDGEMVRKSEKYIYPKVGDEEIEMNPNTGTWSKEFPRHKRIYPTKDRDDLPVIELIENKSDDGNFNYTVVINNS